MSHDIIESIGSNGLDALLFVDFIDGDALVLQSEEEEHEFVDLLLHELLLLLLLSQFQPHMLFFLHEHNFALGDEGRLVGCCWVGLRGDELFIGAEGELL